jgi:holo-[acyl-carrier protein] synthase
VSWAASATASCSASSPTPSAPARRTETLQAGTFAKRFAAKEACAKALGTGFSQGVFHADMGVVNLRSGAPTLALTGGALARLAAITPAGWAAEIALTMTDEPPYAFAQVIIWGRQVPEKPALP